MCSGYAKSLSQKQRCHYFSKLKLENSNIGLPDPYKIVGWEKNMKNWPDLNCSHIHQYLLCNQGAETRDKDTACASLKGYNAFKFGNVKEIEYCLFSPVCFFKAVVVLPHQGKTEAHLAWVCLEKTSGTIKTSHCTCLKR